MDKPTRTHFEHLHSEDRDLRYQAFLALLKTTESPVDWAYEMWDELVRGLRDPDNHWRAICAQLLSNLAQHSDPEQRMLKDFDALLAVTRDERFVTARHSLQAIWKVGAAGKAQQNLLLNAFSVRFKTCPAEKNAALIRFDILAGLKNLYELNREESVKELALSLIELEDNPKYIKKFRKLWPA